MTRSTSRIALPLCGALCLLGAALPAPARAQSPVNNSTCSLPAQSRKEGLINLPTGEDEGFFGGKSIGQPSIAFVMDSSEHMRKLILDVTDPLVVGAALVPGNPASPTARGCNNIKLNTLVYAANPCRTDHDAPTNQGACNAGLPQKPLGTVYDPAYQYEPYADDNGVIFQDSLYYLHDDGWGTDMNNPISKPDATTACTAAGVTDPVENPACATCLDTKGYYVPLNISVSPFYKPEVPPKPVFKGRWLNFYPPRHVVGRHVFLQLFGYFQSQNSARQAQFRTISAADNAVSCYSNNTGLAFDATKDGLTNMGPGAGTTKYRGLCQGGPAQSYWNAVYGVQNMFGGPTPCPAPLVAPNIPADAPVGTTQIVFNQDPVNLQCHGYFADGVGTLLGRAICAPYAEALLQAGSTLANSLSIYNNYFTTAPLNTWVPIAGTADLGICGPTYPCAKGVIILVAGGKPSFDDNIPCEIKGNGIPLGCPNLVVNTTACGVAGPGITGNLPRTANFLANNDFMPGSGFPAPVTINTYVIGFGAADQALLAAADEGKGKFIAANSADGLKAGILEAVRLASTAQITFSSASFSAVQSKTASQLLVPRFTPKVNKALWPGRFYAFRVVSEDACGCKPGVAASAPGADPCDYNKDQVCGGVFFQDNSGPPATASFIAANAQGVFEKATLVAGIFQPNGTPAVPFWEAGAMLTAQTAANRRIFTVIDESAAGGTDGVFDYRDKVIEFNAANAARLAPYLISGPGGVCTVLGNRLNTCLDTVACAARIIDYVRGKDLFDEDCNNATTDRATMLGDIYHSPPVVVDPPLGSKSPVCGLGLVNQCLVSAFRTDTQKLPLTAYDDYVNLNKQRKKIAIVGTNDGLLHAFHTGTWYDCAGGPTPNPPGCVPGIGYYDYGTGAELWAFIPPDLLPKLERLVENERELYVDGSPMVRDIWADGSDGSQPDGKKETGEFHTVAVVGERRGGNHYFGLDVTNPDGPVAESTGFFRWLWPQPNTVASRLAGQSYNDHLPQPPPIGPVRLRNTTIGGLPVYGTPAVPFEERWIVMLSGGYDAAKQRGHTVDMVDVWFGGQGVAGPANDPRLAVWTFNPTSLPGAVPFSFAAVPSLVGFGKRSTNTSSDNNGYYFDTATIGDTGGQLWTLRFNHPDPANWAGGRALVTDNNTPTNYCARQPFYSMTSNGIAVKGGHLRSLIGSGDRPNLTDLNGGECSYDNLLACQRRGCALSVSYTLANACGTTTTFTRSFQSGSAASCTQNPDVETIQVPAVGADCCAPGGNNDLNGSITVTLTGCPGAPGNITWTNQATCQAVTAGTSMCGNNQIQTYVCDPVSKTPFNMSIAWPGGYNSNVNQMPGNAMYSVKIFDSAGPRQLFDTPAAAAAYDAARLKPSNLISVNPLTVTGNAQSTDNGWVANYIHGNPTHASVYPAGFAGSDVNERTAGGSTLVGGCAFWASYLPANNTPACVPSTNGLNTQYNLNFVSGGACIGLDPALASASYSQGVNTSPPVQPQLTEFVSPDGTISIALVGVPRQSGAAASVTRIATSQELIKDSYTVDVTRPEHLCRHAPGPPGDLVTQRLAAQQNCF